MIERLPLLVLLLLLSCRSGSEVLAQGETGAGSGPALGQIYGEGASPVSDLSRSGEARERFSLRLGYLQLQPHAEAWYIYDDNVNLSSDSRKGEGYATFAPGAKLLYGNERRNYVYLDYTADFSTLSTPGEGTLFGQTATLFGHYETTRSQATLWHRYREVNDLDTALGARISKTENFSFANLDHRVSTKTTVGALVSHELHNFDDPEYSDYRQYEGAGRLYWSTTPRTELYGEARHGWVDVDHDGGDYGSAQFTEGSIGIRGKPRPRLTTTGQVGYQHRTFDDSRIKPFSHWVGGGKVEAKPFEFFQTWLGVWCAIRPAANAPGISLIETRIEPGISRRLWTDRLVGSLSGVVGFVDYRGTSDPDAREDQTDARVYDGRRDTFWGYTLNVDWWFAKYWSMGVGYSYIRNESDVDSRQRVGQVPERASYDGGRWMARASFNM